MQKNNPEVEKDLLLGMVANDLFIEGDAESRSLEQSEISSGLQKD